MAGNIKSIASKLGAKVIASVPDAQGGAFGASRVARIVAELQNQLRPGEGKRPGRPTNPKWVVSLKIPMSSEVDAKLSGFAAKASKEGHRVSKMQIAAQLLEEAVKQLDSSSAG